MGISKQKQFNKFKNLLQTLFIEKKSDYIFKYYHIYLLGIIFIVFHVFYKVPYTINYFTIVEMIYAAYSLLLGSIKTSYTRENYYYNIYSNKVIQCIVRYLLQFSPTKELKYLEWGDRMTFENICDSDFFRRIRIRFDILFVSLFIFGYYQLYPYNNVAIFYALYFIPILASYYYFNFKKSLYVVIISTLIYCFVLHSSNVPFFDVKSIFLSQLFIFIFLIFVLEYYRTRHFSPKITALENKIDLHNRFTLILSNLQKEGHSALRNPSTASTELDSLLRQFAEVMQSSVVTLFLIEKNRLVLRAAKGYPSDLINKAFYEKGEGLTGMVWENENSVMLRDAIQHPGRKGKYSKYIEAEQDAKALHFLGVPIKNDREIIGVITAVRAKKNTETRVYLFDKGDEEFIKTISLLIANSYEKEKNKAVIHQIYEISKKINGITDYGKILKEIVKAPSEFMDVYLCTIFIKEGNELVVKETWCQNEEHKKISHKVERIPLSESVTYEALKKKSPIVFKDFPSRISHPVRKKIAMQIGLKTLLCIPLFQGDEEIGTLNIFTNKPHDFSQSEIENATIFADQLLHAIQYNEGKLRALNNMLRLTRLINSPTNPEKIYDAILKSAFNLTRANVGAIVLIDRYRGIASCVFQKGFPKEYKIKGVPSALKKPHCLAISVNKTIYKHEDVKKECGLCPFPEKKELGHRYCIPIKSNNEIIGNLFLGCMEERSVVNLTIPFFFDIFTEQIAIVVAKTQAYLEMKALNKIGKELLSDPANPYKKIVKTIRKKIQSETCSLYVKSSEGFKLVESNGYTKELSARVYQIGEGLIGSVAKERETIISDYIEDDHRWSNKENKELISKLPTSTSFIGTPIFDKHKNVIGIITLTKEKFSKKSKIPAFIDKHEQFLEAFASMASIAIENARYAEQIENNTKNEAERKNRESLELMVKGTAHELQNPFLNMEIYTGELIKKTPKDDARYDMLKVIKESLKQSQSVVKNLSSFAKLDKIKTASYCMSEIVSELIRRNEKRYTRKNIRYEIGFNIRDDRCLMDISYFKQVLTNFLRNAEEAIPVNSGFIKITTFRNNGFIGLRIEDNGPGFPKESFDSVFNMYYTTKKDGAGIGLALSRSIIEKMGGTIEIGNKEIGGAVVSILMPQKENVLTG